MSEQRKALLKPFQLLGIAAGFAVFAALIVLLTIRRLDIALIGGGAVFIVTTVVLAMLVLTYQPNPDAPIYLDRFDAADEGDGEAASGRTGGAERANPSPDADAGGEAGSDLGLR